ncbi:DNA repair protein RadA, partial [Candidatus Woesearchaeota archaeon]|nr:DNA repair protein RadA [Candidatus Woesearchaeota archaeon]
MKNKKGSIFLMAFFVAIVMVIFYMISMQGRAPGIGTSTSIQTETTHNYAEILKRFTYITAEESLTQASYEVGVELADHYIINDAQPNTLDIDAVNQKIADKAKINVNDYLQLVDQVEFGSVKFDESSEITKVEIQVDDIDLLEKTVFENFGAVYTGETATVSDISTGETNTFTHDYTVSTQCDRFYYLYSVMNEWAIANQISTLSCNAIPAVMAKGSGNLYYPVVNEDTAVNIINEAIEDLNS